MAGGDFELRNCRSFVSVCVKLDLIVKKTVFQKENTVVVCTVVSMVFIL